MTNSYSQKYLYKCWLYKRVVPTNNKENMIKNRMDLILINERYRYAV